ncbi:DNA adenine methylase [Parabacteroides distasonis]|uniref:DNA adenine methylase n=1 Tax=Parabacteroides distasonis TaxID=823 RepID=UPI0021662B9A|nr:DNA adenine methylase [Parabacteroides distasonis]MCS2606879.1 DNA adenine methylase [Parabacteroides distasonis]
MRRQYLSAPLPFQGQKRMFAKEFIKVLKHYQDDAVFVDLFGGSGLLSHITKCQKPDATVVYNDFDNYRRRLENIPRTNALLDKIREVVASVPRRKILPEKTKEAILLLIEQEEKERGYVDYITLSTSLLFSMKYATNLDGLRKETFYNTVRKCNYDLCLDYLDGLEVVSCDYRELFSRYKDVPNVVFLIDPPYLSTEVGTYTMNWGLSDYLDVLQTLVGTNYIYFTSNKSSIIELCDWMGRNNTIGNPFTGSKKVEFNARMNYNSSYTDIMLFKDADGTEYKEAV